VRLPEQDIALFYKLNPELLLHVNRRLGILEGVSSADELMALPAEERCEVRDALYEHIELLDEFADQNPLDFTPGELAIVRSWKEFVRGTFYILRYLKKHAIFLDTDSPPKAYGVCCLGDSFEELVPRFALPLMVKAVLLPFNDRIVYDGYLGSYSITFGGGIRRGFKQSYGEAKSRFGIITTLPHAADEDARTDRERLVFYLKNEPNRERYWDEIQELIGGDPELEAVYHQQMGRAQARKYRRRLRESGVRGAWFAVLDGIIIASGKAKTDVQQTIRDILPAERLDHPYLFRLKETE